MAVSLVRSHAVVFTKTAGTNNLGVNISTATTAGNLLVAYTLCDNSGALKPEVVSIDKPAGETNSWVRLGFARSTGVTPGAACTGEMWAIKTTVSWPIGAYTVTLDASTVMKSTLVQEFSEVDAVLRSTTGNTWMGTTTAAIATTTAPAPVIGDLAIGFLYGSNAAAAQAGDTDTVGGPWTNTTGVGSTGGTTASNNYGITQHKVITATNHQQYTNSAAMTAGNGSIVVILQASPPAPAITQAAYGFFFDDGSDTGSTIAIAQDTPLPLDLTAADVQGHLRFLVQSTNAVTVPATSDLQLQWEKNASGTWNNVTTSSSGVAAFNSTSLVDTQDVTTSRLTGGTGTPSLGRVSETGLITDLGWAANGYTEILYTVWMKAADLANGDTIRFRVLLNGATIGMTYAQTPSIPITKSLPKIETFTDDFSGTLSKWGTYGSSVTITGGQLAATYVNTSYAGAYAMDYYNLHESSIFLKMTPPPVWANRETALTLVNLADVQNGIWVILAENPAVILRVKTAGVNVDKSFAYNATNHAWLRVRLTGTTAYLDTSPDGSTWTLLTSTACTVTLSSVRPELSVGQWSGTGTGTAYFDNVNVPPSAGQALTYSKTDNLGVTDAQTDVITLDRTDTLGLADTYNGSKTDDVSHVHLDNVGPSDSVATARGAVYAKQDWTNPTDAATVAVDRVYSKQDWTNPTDSVATARGAVWAKQDWTNPTDSFTYVLTPPAVLGTVGALVNYGQGGDWVTRGWGTAGYMLADNASSTSLPAGVSGSTTGTRYTWSQPFNHSSGMRLPPPDENSGQWCWYGAQFDVTFTFAQAWKGTVRGYFLSSAPDDRIALAKAALNGVPQNELLLDAANPETWFGSGVAITTMLPGGRWLGWEVDMQPGDVLTFTTVNQPPSANTVASGFVFDPFGTGTAHTRNYTDTLGLTDSFAGDKTSAFAHSALDNIGLSDSVSRALTAVRSASDTLGITDSRAATTALARTDSAALTDSITPELARTLAHSATDQSGLTDSVIATIIPEGMYDPAAFTGCLLGLDARDVAAGNVSVWPDRSAALNNVVVSSGVPTSTGEFVSVTTANVLVSTNPINVVYQAPRHLFARIRSRFVNGSFMGYGAPAEGALFDMWFYTGAGTLIWHGYGGTNDTVNGAPTMTPDEWHVIECFYDGVNIGVRVDGVTVSKPLVLATQAATMLFGLGRYLPASDFDMSSFYFYDRTLVGLERQQVIDYMLGLAGTGVARTHSATDALGLTDSVSVVKDATWAKQDWLNPTDSRTLVVDASRTDTIALTDSITVAVGRVGSGADTLPLTDSRTVALGTTRSDVLDLTDTFLGTKTSAGAYSTTDLIGPVDSWTVVATRAVTPDSAGLTDSVSIARGVVYAKQDFTNPTDYFARGRGRGISDSETLADSLTHTLVMARPVSNTLALTDSMTPLLLKGGIGWPKVYLGTLFVPKPAKSLLGGQWRVKPWKWWTGTEWKMVGALPNWGPDESMYRPGAQPNAPSDPSVFALGNKFTVQVAGRITGIRTWHHNGSGASRFVGLWNANGSVLLASAHSANEVNGWNTTLLPEPVAVAAGQTLVATFGYYGYAADGLFPYSADTVYDNSPNLVWVSGQYSAVTGQPETFPPNSITPNHYWADVVFQRQT